MFGNVTLLQNKKNHFLNKLKNIYFNNSCHNDNNMISLVRSTYSETCLNWTFIRTSFCVWNRQVFVLYRLNSQRFLTYGLYFKFSLYRILFYSGFGWDRFHWDDILRNYIVFYSFQVVDINNLKLASDNNITTRLINWFILHSVHLSIKVYIKTFAFNNYQYIFCTRYIKTPVTWCLM